MEGLYPPGGEEQVRSNDVWLPLNIRSHRPNSQAGLQEGERLLWQGTPDAKLFNRSRLIVYSLLLLPLMPVLVWALGQKAGTNLPLLSPITLGIALAL